MKLRGALAGACVAIWAVGAANSAGAQTPAGDSVTGAVAVTEQQCILVPDVTRCFLPSRYRFDAHSGPAGEAPTGTVVFATGERVGLVTDFGTVSCLSVTGNRASIGVNFQGPFGIPALAHAAVIYVEDLGGEAQDKIAVQDLPAGDSAPTVCPAVRPPSLPLQPTFLVLGPFGEPSVGDFNIIVTDTVNLPATKDQCKNGGWKIYGVFKNQGDCVSFVATGGTNPPANSP